jgi:predicted ATPase
MSTTVKKKQRHAGPRERPVFLSRVVLRNYRSIEVCDVQLGAVTFLVGANGSGKSNFLDALRLVTDSLNTSLDHALRDRGGISEVRRRSSGHPTHFAIRLEFSLEEGVAGFYAFEIGAKPRGEFVVKKEECAIGAHRYFVQEGNLLYPTEGVFPPAVTDRLYLVSAAGLPQFRPVFDALSGMGFYNLNPDKIRELQSPDAGEVLRRDGSNLASVVGRLEKVNDGRLKERIAEFLGQVVPGITGFNTQRVGHMESLEFKQRVTGAQHAWNFPAINMSDGTLRALGSLVALFQAVGRPKVRLVGIEEPETALHPAASGVLRDCVLQASQFVQVVVTSHSSELLDDSTITPETIRAVEAADGRTLIAPLDKTSRTALRDRLYTAGELLRANQLNPDLSLIPRAEQLQLFGTTVQ